MLGPETLKHYWNTNGYGQKNLRKNNNMANFGPANDEPRRLRHNRIINQRRRTSVGKYGRRGRDLYHL